jgi:lipopolysaccharide transport system ATP-binding protein
MSEIVVSLKNISKSFKRYARPVDRLKELLLPGKSKAEEFWALQDITLDIPKGQTLGILGRNGSGKSTLLQIIAGTLTPTTGEVQIKGRVSALLELGSGFNPEFTGRQNVFFNGKLLGLSHQEIEERFKEIETFAEIGDFIDQPVKTYSSGMFVRLAFSVAANLEPDILIVDEALAVGDIFFQHKCIGKIKDLQKRGTTIIFVSHAPDMVKAICDTGLLLEQGRIAFEGNPDRAMSKYLKGAIVERNEINLKNNQETTTLNQDRLNQIILNLKEDKEDLKDIGIKKVWIENIKGQETIYVQQGEWITIHVIIENKLKVKNLSIGLTIRDESGIELTGTSLFNENVNLNMIELETCFLVSFKMQVLLKGGHSYSVCLRLNSVSRKDRSDNVVLLEKETAAVFQVAYDPDNPMWFKFFQPISIFIDGKIAATGNKNIYKSVLEVGK